MTVTWTVAESFPFTAPLTLDDHNHTNTQWRTKRMQATARRLSVVSATSTPRRRLIRSVRPTSIRSVSSPEQISDIIAAHKASSLHRNQLAAEGVRCGCFHCCKTFAPSCITEWVDEDDSGNGQTAMCPLCGIDSVIGSCSGYPITTEFLAQMKLHWFGAD